jgi:hypothetical protein
MVYLLCKIATREFKEHKDLTVDEDFLSFLFHYPFVFSAFSVAKPKGRCHKEHKEHKENR